MFVPIKNKKVYQHVIEQIQNMVMEGTLKKGDKLPSERDLVAQLGVSRTSIREALRSLEVIGLIESRQGEGNFISGNIDSSFFEPLSVMFMLNKGNPESILELRMIIEVEAAAIAAKKIKEEDIEEMKNLMDELRKAQNEIESAKVDKKLHYKIAQITGNYLIVTLLNAISSLMESFIKDARGMILREEEKREVLMEQHQKICDALIEKDSKKAILAMKEHLETINETMKKLPKKKII
ncbi:FadR/GntR family transcriptional regulator [Crassaminicella profunda]|uniref:FadR/GntR family transcriptional regulator n=1 Tax=Crassaminicella profunda TaxID=1286698 RepID=UPI001CA6C313|nr:FadR/GntR family transcriptional regulator [Crassaminicella profunda]QZY53744.1 FadR family transcriptional regulator [Crassaminicella profunda]